MWFVIHTAQKAGNSHYLSRAVKAIERAINVGWDPGFGGLFRFVDKSGGEPKGRKKATSYEQQIIDS